MRILYIEYSLWKSITQTRGFESFHEQITTDTVKVWAGDPEIVYATDIEPVNFADFLADFSDSEEVANEDEAIANISGLGQPLQPRAVDGRPIVLSVRYRGDVTPFFAGSSDGPSGKGGGPIFLIRWNNPPTEIETKEENFSFSDWIYIAKGHIRWTNAGPGDYAGVDLRAPATTVVANTGAGNCNLIPTGLGFNIIVPAAGDGSHDYSNPVPVPAFGSNGKPNGNWTWDEPDEGKGNVTFVGDGNSPYNLFDAELTLAYWIRKLPLIGDGEQTLHPEGKAKKVLPQWEFHVTVRNKSLSALQVTWTLDGARKVTV